MGSTHFPASNSSFRGKLITLLVTVILSSTLGITFLTLQADHRFGFFSSPSSNPNKPSPPAVFQQPQTLDELLAIKPQDLAQVDLARMNLICAQGLPGTEPFDLEKSLHTINQWADQVRRYADGQLVQFLRKPADYGNSEAVFRMLALLDVLQNQGGVRSNHPYTKKVDFSRAQELFIAGPVNTKTNGTRFSLPMLYTAVARKLGWPVHLVLAKDHVFCRWEGTFEGRTERINLEPAGRGLNAYPDGYYKKWPKAISDQEIKQGQYLKTLTSAEELAVCLVNRGYCLQANKRLKEAAAMYEQAYKLIPQNQQFATLAGKAVHLTKEELDQLERDAQKNLVRGQGPDFGPDNMPRRYGPPDGMEPGMTSYSPVAPRPGGVVDPFNPRPNSDPQDLDSPRPGSGYRPPPIPGVELPNKSTHPE